MTKKAFFRGLLGFPLGIAIGYIINIFISLILGKGQYLACLPALKEAMGSEINAVVFQTILSGLLGSGFSACSVIWEIEAWSIVKQTGLYFVITSILMITVAYFSYWMEHSLRGFLIYFGIFVLIFIAIWVVQYFTYKIKIKKINAKL